ncbi:MAG: hypothetical protein VXV96_09615 [Bdellovibrionota bacterium]|nr:hypothetical protein [Bdellovibrionota bacterium]
MDKINRPLVIVMKSQRLDKLSPVSTSLPMLKAAGKTSFTVNPIHLLHIDLHSFSSQQDVNSLVPKAKIFISMM